MKEWKRVTKQELIDFLEGYPFPFLHDLYMDWHSWNDYRDGRQWPESMIAKASIYDDEFEIYDGYIQETSEPPKESEP